MTSHERDDIMRNWRTTLLGFGIGFLNLYANGMNVKQAALSIGMAALGTVAKDFTVSGTGA